jgi:hypothetical protein
MLRFCLTFNDWKNDKKLYERNELQKKKKIYIFVSRDIRHLVVSIKFELYINALRTRRHFWLYMFSIHYGKNSSWFMNNIVEKHSKPETMAIACDFDEYNYHE